MADKQFPSHYEIAKILADNFTPATYDDSDFEWCAYQLELAGYRKQQDWISIVEGLPNERERVLVSLKNNGYNGVNHTIIDTDRRINGRWVRWSGYVTHWMPLPEAPKGEQ